jgi:hypothetical protein
MCGCITRISGTPFTKQMFFSASENTAGIPGTNVTLVPVFMAAASSRPMKSGLDEVCTAFDGRSFFAMLRHSL